MILAIFSNLYDAMILSFCDSMNLCPSRRAASAAVSLKKLFQNWLCCNQLMDMALSWRHCGAWKEQVCKAQRYLGVFRCRRKFCQISEVFCCKQAANSLLAFLELLPSGSLSAWVGA